MKTTPPGGERILVLYDGHCRFCTASAKQLVSLRGERHLELLSFQEPGVLERFPGLTHEACMKRLHVVFPDGRVYAGAEAVTRVVATLPVLGLPAYLYYVPGIRQASEAIYDLVAKNRYKIAGRDCDGGTCHLHGE